MDRFHAMETFIRVVDTGSFSAAGRNMNIGQPAVSKIVAGLEDRLQVRLLVRSTRRLSPTEAGQAFYERARRAIDEADEAEASARGLAAGLEGRLRVCAPVTFARLHIAPRLGTFLNMHPKLRLEAVMDDRNVDLLEENIDLAFRLGDLPDSTLTARKIATGTRLLLAAPEYVARVGPPKVPSDLLAHHAVTYAQQAGGAAWHFNQGTDEISVCVPSRVQFTAAEGLREGVLAGLGVAVASRWMFERELAEGRLVTLLTDWTLPSIDLWALFPAGRLPSAKARAFLAWFEAYWRNG